MHISLRSLSVILMLCLAGALSSAATGAQKKPTPLPIPPQEYRLGADDVISVFVWKEPDLSTTLTVGPDGRISMPLINDVQASGKTALQLQDEIKQKLSNYITDPLVTVSVREFNSFKFSVLGEVRTPGVYKSSQRVTVLDAIAMAGGFTEFAKRDDVTVIRNGNQDQRININLKKYLKNGKSENLYLEPADVVYVK